MLHVDVCFCRTPSEDRESNDDDCVLIERPEIDGKYLLESSYNPVTTEDLVDKMLQ